MDKSRSILAGEWLEHIDELSSVTRRVACLPYVVGMRVLWWRNCWERRSKLSLSSWRKVGCTWFIVCMSMWSVFECESRGSTSSEIHIRTRTHYVSRWIWKMFTVTLCSIFYALVTRYCRRRHYVFGLSIRHICLSVRLFVHSFVRRDFVTTMSPEWLEESWWNLQGIFYSRYWWPD